MAEGYLHLLLKVFDHEAKVWMNYDPNLLHSPPGPGRLSVDIKRAAYFLPIGRMPQPSTAMRMVQGGAGENFAYLVCMSIPEFSNQQPDIRLLVSGRKRKGKEIKETQDGLENDCLYFYRAAKDIRRFHIWRDGASVPAEDVFYQFKPVFASFLMQLAVLRDGINATLESNYQLARRDTEMMDMRMEVEMAAKMAKDMAEDTVEEDLYGAWEWSLRMEMKDSWGYTASQNSDELRRKIC